MLLFGNFLYVHWISLNDSVPFDLNFELVVYYPLSDFEFGIKGKSGS